jgi:hypothetical protein
MTESKKSGVKGVYWQKNAECWVVKVYELLEEGGKKKQQYLGRSKDLEEAKKILEDHKALRLAQKLTNLNPSPVHIEAMKDPEGGRTPTLHAENYLRRSIYALNQRARDYDSLGGEKSIGKTIELFNKLTGNNLSDSQGWLFMVCLKLVRSQQGTFHMDNFVDLAAYAALYGESQEKEVPEPEDEEYDAMHLAVNT